ncbi:MAG: PRC-barrel domain-containing protein [Thermofilum sp.]
MSIDKLLYVNSRIKFMGITLSELKGKNVYTQDARRIGEIIDFGFKIGETTPFFVVRTPSGKPLEIPWSSVAAAKDIVLLKPDFQVPEDLLVQPAMPVATPQTTQAQPAQQPRFGIFKKSEQKICPYCGKPATWIPQYQRWYCYNCQKYID